MRQFIFIFLSLFLICSPTFAQSKINGDQKLVAVKVDPNWNKADADAPNSIVQTTVAEGIIFYSTVDGIFITLPTATNNVKLFALTGDVVWSGNLVQGRFFIPTRPGIYFLRINNKSYKVVCK